MELPPPARFQRVPLTVRVHFPGAALAYRLSGLIRSGPGQGLPRRLPNLRALPVWRKAEVTIPTALAATCFQDRSRNLPALPSSCQVPKVTICKLQACFFPGTEVVWKNPSQLVKNLVVYLYGKVQLPGRKQQSIKSCQQGLTPVIHRIRLVSRENPPDFHSKFRLGLPLPGDREENETPRKGVKEKMRFTEELSEIVKADSGVTAVTMRDLRDGFGYKRLGPGVVSVISGELKAVGLGHFPVPLPDDQRQTVLIYQLNSVIEPVLKAVTEPSEESVGVLRHLGSDVSEDSLVLSQVRQLVNAPVASTPAA